MNRSEAKYLNTAQKMQQALIGLLDKKEFNAISISEICKLAEVNRSTFYAHYQNTYDLLLETHNSTMKNFFNHFKNINLDAKDDLYVSQTYLIPFLEFVKNNQKVFNAYLHNMSFLANQSYEMLLRDFFQPMFKKYGVIDTTLINYMTKFYLQGITAIVTTWLENNCADDILFLCEIITICVKPEGHNKIKNYQ